MTLVTMSEREFGRLRVLQELQAGGLDVNEARTLLGVSRRHVFRLQASYRARGAEGLASRRRGKPSNRRYDRWTRALAVQILIEEFFPSEGKALGFSRFHELKRVGACLEHKRQIARNRRPSRSGLGSFRQRGNTKSTMSV